MFPLIDLLFWLYRKLHKRIVCFYKIYFYINFPLFSWWIFAIFAWVCPFLISHFIYLKHSCTNRCPSSSLKKWPNQRCLLSSALFFCWIRFVKLIKKNILKHFARLFVKFSLSSFILSIFPFVNFCLLSNFNHFQ